MRNNGIVKKARDWKKITGGFLLITLILSIIYVIIRILLLPGSTTDAAALKHLRSDYLLMLVQCILGVIVMSLPSLIELKWPAIFPDFIHISYFFFLFCAIFLGEVFNFYYLIPNFDSVLHALGGGLLGALGYVVASAFQKPPSKNKMGPLLTSVFIFCFAFATGVLWEMYEFVFDGLLSLNMQKFALSDGTPLVGRAALSDTMKDIIIDAASAFVVAFIGYFAVKWRKKVEHQ